MRLVTLAVAAVALAGCDKSISERAENDEITTVADDDPAMERAFAKARSTLDEFLSKAESPPAGTTAYAVKVALSDGDNTEYFWVADFTVDGDTMSGVLNNEPRTVKRYRMGERFSFPRSTVVDWTYLEPEIPRMHGNFTACALLVHEDPQEAAAFRKEYGLECDG